VAFERVLRFVPVHGPALYYSAVQLAEEHRYDEAIERWSALIAAQPDSDLARRARMAARSAADLRRIFIARERRGAA
jgi:cytochrome c-type biogenesis protein CcmH/NrfG